MKTIVLLFLTAALAAAQQSPRDRGLAPGHPDYVPPQAGPSDPVAENLFPPELVMAHQKAINLEEAPKNAIRAELLKAQAKFTEWQWHLQDHMETLTGLLKQQPTEEGKVLDQLEKVLAAEREIKRTQISLMVRIKNLLSAEQQSRLRQLRAKN